MKYKLYCEGLPGANLRDNTSGTSKLFPSVVLRSDSFQTQTDDVIGEGELPLSMVYSAGESKPYSLYFFEGSESRWFFREKKYLFEVLFNKMATPAEPHWSRLMKRVVLVNNNGPLFEMMDGRLYLFDIKTEILSCFFIERSSQIKTIGSGIMSNVIMVQTTDGRILKKPFTESPKEIEINDPSPVKLFSSYCRDLQIIVLENNKFYIIKDGSVHDAHYGFSDCDLGNPVEISTSVFESGIKKVSSGYGHCAILLENGQVFMRGLNNYNQCITGDATDIEGRFYQVKTGRVLDIDCGSICTALQTSTHFHFYGSIKNDLDKTGYSHEIEYEDQQLSLGPWHALIFRNKYKTIGKSEIYFMNNLKAVSKNFSPPYSDILFK